MSMYRKARVWRAGCSEVLGSFVFLSLILVAQPVLATTMVKLSLNELADASVVVARVKVENLKVIEGEGVLSTVGECRVLESFKGSREGAVLKVLIPGGIKGDLLQKVPGAPKLQEGDEAMVFLELRGGGMFRFVGLEQGYLRIVEGSSGPAIESSPQARYVVRDSRGQWVASSPPARSEPLSDFLRRLRPILEND